MKGKKAVKKVNLYGDLAEVWGGKNGAGEGNRTLMASLEGWSFTTKLHPQSAFLYHVRLQAARPFESPYKD